MTIEKIWDVDHPPVVVLVGSDERLGDLEAALRSETDYRIEREPAAAAALDRLDGDPAVECLWIPETLPDGEGVDLVETATVREPATSVVLAPSQGSEALAARATAAGATEYVASSASIDERVDRVTAAVDRAVHRRHDARKRSALDAMLSELDVSMFAKDELARHVVYADREYAPDPEEVFGKTDLEAFPTGNPELEDSYRDDLSVIEEGRRVDGKVESYEEQGGRWQWTKKVPWTEDGETRGLVGLTLDISEWKRRERELLHQVGRLQQIPEYVTHDLRNPLGIARGYLQLARDGDEAAFDTIEDALDRMEELLEDFQSLATSTLESDGDHRPLDLAAEVEEVWQYVTMPGAHLEIEVPDGTTIVANEAQLRPLLQNLLHNAIDHAGPRVTVRVGLLSDGFYVADDGPGLGPVADTDLFREGITTVSDGSGLGLAIVREAAHLHGWDVGATESESGGARFEVRGCLGGRPLDVDPTGETVELTDSTDVGNPEIAGTVSVGGPAGAGTEPDVVDGTAAVRVAGAGENVWGYVNEFHFVHGPAPHGVRIQARLPEVGAATPHSKAGLMVRSDRESDASYGFVGRRGDDAPEVLWRPVSGRRGTSDQIDGLEAEIEWVRLERLGDEVACSVSGDGESWSLVDRRRVDLGDAPLVGLAVCSVDPAEAIEARFEDVEVVRVEH